MQRPLAVLLVLIGVVGLVLGRLGETTWAPETETTATAELSDPGSAVVIDPGVLYVGGDEGQVVIEGASDVSVITAANGDIDAYLEDVRHTRITGASDWTTLSTQEVDPDGAEELDSPTSSDLWRSVETRPSPYTLEVSDFWAGEHGENEQVYRAILIVTDGTEPGADSVSITWPVDAENEWVPFAYAGGAAIAVIGLVLLVVSIGGRRHDEDDERLEQDAQQPVPAQPVGAGAATGAAAGAADADEDTPQTPEQVPDEDRLDDLFAAPAQPVREENVWSYGERTASEPSAEEPTEEFTAVSAEDPGERSAAASREEAPSEPSGAEAETAAESAPEEETGGPARLFGDDEERR